MAAPAVTRLPRLGARRLRMRDTTAQVGEGQYRKLATPALGADDRTADDLKPRCIVQGRNIASFSEGAFSNRDSVGCEHRFAPVSGSRPHASLKAGPTRKESRSSGSS